MKICHCGKKVHSRGLCSGHYSAWWRANNPQRDKKMRRDYYKENRDREIEKAKKWNISNKIKAKESNKKYVRKSNYYASRYKSDENFRLRIILRNRLLQSIRCDQKVGSAVSDLGCSIDELKQHLESKFQPGMSWDNYGEWHIDHIKPLASFNLTKRDDFLKACHYTNLQPLWAEDNLRKSNSEL